MADIKTSSSSLSSSDEPQRKSSPRGKLRAGGNFYEGLSNSNLLFFTENSLYEIESLAASLSVDEVLDYYGLTMDDLIQGEAAQSPPGIQFSELSDLYWFNRAFKRGRSRAKLLASDRLFTSMNSRQGKEACIAYLKQFAVNFAESSESDGNANNKFSFTVNLDD